MLNLRFGLDVNPLASNVDFFDVLVASGACGGHSGGFTIFGRVAWKQLRLELEMWLTYPFDLFFWRLLQRVYPELVRLPVS